MKRFLFLLAGLLAASAAAAQSLPVSGVLLDSYAAVVNGKVVTVGEVLSALQPVQERLAARHAGAELEQKIVEEYARVRDSLIESELILLDFEMQGGTLPDRAIEDHINTVIHERFDNDRAAFLRALAEERLTFAEWRKQMKDQLIVQMMLQQSVQAKVVVTPIDLQRAYEARRVSFSSPAALRLRTFAVPEGEDPAALRQSILDGQADSAATNSPPAADPEWYDLSSLNADILAAVDSLSPGDVSAPVQLAGASYLVQLLDRREARVRPFAEAAPELERELRRSENERLRRIWIDSLRAKYFVQLYSHDIF